MEMMKFLVVMMLVVTCYNICAEACNCAAGAKDLYWEDCWDRPDQACDGDCGCPDSDWQGECCDLPVIFEY